jgi:hypothetical protein
MRLVERRRNAKQPKGISSVGQAAPRCSQGASAIEIQERSAKTEWLRFSADGVWRSLLKDVET